MRMDAGAPPTRKRQSPVNVSLRSSRSRGVQNPIIWGLVALIIGRCRLRRCQHPPLHGVAAIRIFGWLLVLSHGAAPLEWLRAHVGRALCRT
jgi:hypothetical protein